MKKLSKKLLAVLLTMVMVMGLGVTSFAAEKTITVKFVDKVTGKVNVTQPVTINDTGFTTLFTIPNDVDYVNKNIPTAMDYTVKAADQSGNGTTLVYAWDKKPSEGDPGVYMTSFKNLQTKTVKSHYSDIKGESYWIGNSWMLYINGVEASAYASNIKASDITGTIEWRYVQTKEVW